MFFIFSFLRINLDSRNSTDKNFCEDRSLPKFSPCRLLKPHFSSLFYKEQSIGCYSYAKLPLQTPSALSLVTSGHREKVNDTVRFHFGCFWGVDYALAKTEWRLTQTIVPERFMKEMHSHEMCEWNGCIFTLSEIF